MSDVQIKSQFMKEIEDICEEAGIKDYQAFPRWLCQNILGITNEGHVDEAVSIGGKGDYGIGVFYADENEDVTEQYVCWMQAKFSDSLDHRVTWEEIETFANTLGHLKDCPNQANRTFKQKSAEFLKIHAKYPDIKKRMIYAVTGRLNDQAKELINNPRWLEEKFGRQSNTDLPFEILELDDILSRLTIPHTPSLQITFDSDVLTKTDVTTEKKSILGYVSADSLVKLAKDHKEVLCLENPRQTIGITAPTHKAILNTLCDSNSRKKFWKLNNGITAICTRISNSDDPKTYRIDNFKIVNGRQTTYTLENSTKPIDDVLLLMTIHETADDKERNMISEATNTQNPIKPADLVTNYFEMTELELQCKKDYPEFYFERQSKGFASENKVTQQRVTSRRLMEKGITARAYYAYAIDPNDAMLSDKILFSTTNTVNYYDRIFKESNIRDLIIPHIFMQMLDALHNKWCQELRDNPSDKVSRNKGIISKDNVKYYILRFIYESMMSIDQSRRESIKDKIIEKFRILKKNEPMPEIFVDVAKAAYHTFMLCYDADRTETWPPEILKRIKDDKHQEQTQNIPSPYDIMYMLKKDGKRTLPHLLQIRRHMIKLMGDKVELKLVEINST